MQRHQEKVRSAAVAGETAVKPRADASAVPVGVAPAVGSAGAAPAKRAAPVPGRRSFGGFNPHIQVANVYLQIFWLHVSFNVFLQAHCDRLVAASIRFATLCCSALAPLHMQALQHHRLQLERFFMVAFRSASSDFEQPRSLQHLVDDAEQHADVKVKRVLSPPPPPRRPRPRPCPCARRPTRPQSQWVSRSHAAASTSCISMRLASSLLIIGVLCARGFIHSALAPAHGSLPRPAVSPPLQLARCSFASQSALRPSQTLAVALALPQSTRTRARSLPGCCAQTLVFPFPGVVKLCWPFPASARAKASSLWKLEQNARGGAGQDWFITMQRVAGRRMHTRSRCGFLHGLHGGKKQNFL